MSRAAAVILLAAACAFPRPASARFGNAAPVFVDTVAAQVDSTHLPHRQVTATDTTHARPTGAVRPRRPALRRPTTRRGTIEGRVIRSVDVVPHNVFDPVPPSRLAPFHRLADRLHITTRASTVKRQLLFEPGDRWSEDAARETARNLRALDYLQPQRIEAEAAGDSVQVRVETRDVWTTSPQINVESGGGRHSGSVGFTERNLFGLGKSIGFDYRDEPTGISRHVSYEDPVLFNSRHQLKVSAGTATDGASNAFSVGLPWYALRTPHAWEVSASRATFVTQMYARASQVAHFDDRLETMRAALGMRLPSSEMIARLTGSFELEDHRRGPSIALPGAPPAFLGGEETMRHRLLASELRVWRPRYVELEDINRMDRIEDFDLGASATAKVGWSGRLLGATEDEAFVGFSFDGGTLTPGGFGWVHAGTGGWLRPQPLDVTHQIEARWFVLLPAHTVAFAAHGVAATHTSRGFQARVGGLSGLRAYPVAAVAGERLWRFNAEDRWLVSPPDWTLLKLGTAAFWDGARAWGAGAEGTKWFHDAGVGLRIGLPQFGLSEVLRVDVAWPIDPTRDRHRAAVLSFGSSQAF